ncbi:MAG: hypothetical protein JO248_11250 [Acidimicrobiia bacterium]|nr:hypothetical protein [Acidimicrobiia bacterium]MBV9284427.1 hypothetical protein [Acidimicrobiia bacterium]
MHRSRVVLVVVATLVSVGAGVAWGMVRPNAASSSNKRESEYGQVHLNSPNAAAGAGAVEGIKARWVQAENAKPGTSDWRVSNAGKDGDLEGYADKVSAQQGDTVRLFVSTKESGYHVEAYRIGYYGGLGARLVWKSGELPGHLQAAATRDKQTNMVEAPWSPSLSVPLTSGFPPGVYLFKLVGDSGVQHYVPLTIRDDRSTAAFVIQNSVTTWQAYNLWAGYDLYEGKNGSGGSDFEHRARVVSFDRPYSMGAGSGDFLGNEFPLISLAESLGLDVTYWTDVDLHERGQQLLTRHKALLTLGHDEYWSPDMRSAAEHARDQGVNLAFFGANAVFRKIRFDASQMGADRHETDYKSAREDPMNGTDNKAVTVDWRLAPISQPESTLIGDFYECNPVKADMIVGDPSAWIYAGTGLDKGDRLRNLVGPEYDRFDASGPKNVQIMARSPVDCRGKASYSDMTYYSAPSGAGVWASGTNWWISKLSEDCPAPPSVTTTTSSTTTTIPATPRATKKTPICPKQPVIDMTENVLNLFGVGPAGRTQASAGTNLKQLNSGLPAASDNTGETTPTTRSRTRTRSTYTVPQYAPRETPSTEPSYSPPPYTYTPPTYPPRETPTTRARPIIGG